jgi:Tol biopolymer transport system component
MLRRVLVAAVVLLALIAATGSASSTAISPCRQVSQPTWSTDGTGIAFYGTRWPPPAHPHRNPNDILQALCTANADGTNAQPLRYTVCSERCPDPPGQLAWLPSGLFFLRDGEVYRIAPGSKPVKVVAFNGSSFAADVAGDRIAGGQWPSCTTCAGPVTVYSLSTGRRLGVVGGKQLYNVDPSLSPDGSQVVFERDAVGDSGKLFGVWAAKVDGSHLRRLAKIGQEPLWSPAGGSVAYVARAASVGPRALRLVSAGGGKSRTLVARGVSIVFGWSPDGTSVAFEAGNGTFGKLAVVDVATGKVRTLLMLSYSPTAVWSPDSTELLVNTVTKVDKATKAPECWSTWRVPADGAKPTRISGCGS